MSLVNKGQNATSEENGQIAQGGRDATIINYSGMSYGEVSSLVRDILKVELSLYASEAKLEFERRIKIFTEEFYNKIFESKSDLFLSRFSEPSIQYSYRTAVIKYCKEGDDHKKDILIDLIVSKFAMKDAKMDNIASDVAVEGVDKITNYQIDLLTFYAFTSVFLKTYQINSFNDLGYYMETVASCMFPKEENIFFGNMFLEAAGFVRVDVYEETRKSINYMKTLIWGKFSKFFQEKKIDWSLDRLNNNPNETDTDRNFFPHFSAACTRMRDENSTVLQVTPAGIMLANKNLSLKRPEFPKIKGNFFG